MRIVLSIFICMALCGCKSETKIETAAAPEEKPIITEETQAEDADVRAEVQLICQTLNACWAAEKAGNKCDAKDVLKAMTLKSPYGAGLRDRLVSSDLAKKSLDELAQNARGLGAKCNLEVKGAE